MKGIILESDALISLENFWDSINSALMMSLQSNHVLPDYRNLDITFNPRNVMIPSIHDPNYTRVTNAYNNFARVIKEFIASSGTIEMSKAPKAYETLVTNKLERDGFQLLWILISKGSPQLGGFARDLQAYVQTLEMIDGEPIIDFYLRATDMWNEIEIQQDKTGQANRLIFRFVTLLSEIYDFYHAFVDIRMDFEIFFCQQDNHLTAFPTSLKQIYENQIVAKKLPDKIDFSMKYRKQQLPHQRNLHNPIANQGRFTQQELRANVQQKMNKNNQRPKFVPLSNKPCPCCSYSNRDIIKLLSKIHPPDGDPSKCCFRGPDHNVDKDMREKLHQFNLKNPNDKKQNSTNKDRIGVMPKPPVITCPKINAATIEDENIQRPSEEDDNEEYYFEELTYPEDNENELYVPQATTNHMYIDKNNIEQYENDEETKIISNLSNEVEDNQMLHNPYVASLNLPPPIFKASFIEESKYKMGKMRIKRIIQLVSL